MDWKKSSFCNLNLEESPAIFPLNYFSIHVTNKWLEMYWDGESISRVNINSNINFCRDLKRSFVRLSTRIIENRNHPRRLKFIESSFSSSHAIWSTILMMYQLRRKSLNYLLRIKRFSTLTTLANWISSNKLGKYRVIENSFVKLRSGNDLKLIDDWFDSNALTEGSQIGNPVQGNF